MESLLRDIRHCQICAEHLPLGPRPIVTAHPDAEIVIIGQAPGSIVHSSGVPWDDASGRQLRKWLGVTEAEFYDETKFALVPMGFCYPGKGSSGDLPPRPECAPQWHDSLLSNMPALKLTLLIGTYSQHYYLAKKAKKTLTETVRAFHDYSPVYLPLPHPSPRNRFWLRKNPWFDQDVLPLLQARVESILR